MPHPVRRVLPPPCATLPLQRDATACPADRAKSIPARQTIAQTIFQRRFHMFPEPHNSRETFPRPIHCLQRSECSSLLPPFPPLALQAQSLPPASPRRHFPAARTASISPRETTSKFSPRPDRDLLSPSKTQAPHRFPLASIPPQSELRSRPCTPRKPARQTIRLADRSRRPLRPRGIARDSHGWRRPLPAPHSAPRESPPIAPVAHSDTRATALLSAPLPWLEDAHKTA